MIFELDDLRISPYAFPGVRYLKGTSDKDIAERIITYACDYFGEQKVQVQSRTRKKGVVKTRSWSVYFICHKTTLTLEQIGQLFYNGFDHTDVINSRQRIATQLTAKHDNVYKTDYVKLTEMLRKQGII